MNRPAIFFDRDNTLIRNDGYLGDPAGVVLIEGAADAIARLRSFGYAIVTFSNQSGVARGMFTEDAVRAVNAKMDELLLAQNPDAVIEGHEFCPYHPQGTVEEYRQDSDLRKPKAGMILKAADALALDLTQSWVVGDAPRDIEAGRAAGCKTILFHDPKLPPSEAAKEAAMGEPDYAVPTFARVVEIIRRNTPGLEPAPAPVMAKTEEPPKPQAADPRPQGDVEQRAEDAKAAAAPQQKPAGTFGARVSESRRSVASPAPLPPPAALHMPTARLEILAQQTLDELRRHREFPAGDFSVSKLFASIVQVLAAAAMFLSFLYRAEPALVPIMLLAIFLQVLTVALLMMGQQR
jgi:D,D-heptose 1,7-bisphosphate phosphatase